MTEFLAKHSTPILSAAALTAISAGIGYIFGTKYGEGKTHFKSYNKGRNPLVDYISDHSLREPENLKLIREETMKKCKLSIMLSDPLEGQFLRLLLKAIGAKRCIEIGVFTGYNICSMASALPHDGEIIACDISEDYINIGKPFWDKEDSKKIDVRIGPAVDTLDTLINEGQEGTFDFVFIDADKVSYDAYYERALVLLRKGGIIAIDNTLWGGCILKDERTHNKDTHAIHSLNKKVKMDERVEISLLNLGDGTTICRKI